MSILEFIENIKNFGQRVHISYFVSVSKENRSKIGNL